MNSSTNNNRPRPVSIRQTELLWTAESHSQSRLQTCCFYLSDWLIYVIATLSILLSGIAFIAFTVSKPPFQYLLHRLPLQLPARTHRGHPLQH